MAAAGDDAAKRMRLSGGDGNAAVTLTRDEATQYDRQIRLWGVNAQNRFVGTVCFAPTVSGRGGRRVAGTTTEQRWCG